MRGGRTMRVFFFQAEDGIRDWSVTGVQTCALPIYAYAAAKAAPDQMIQALAAASDKLTSDFGTWKTPWGDINRYQRLSADITQKFNDAGPSIRSEERRVGKESRSEWSR